MRSAESLPAVSSSRVASPSSARCRRGSPGAPRAGGRPTHAFERCLVGAHPGSRGAAHVAGQARAWRRSPTSRRGLAGLACLATLPDVDLLLGIHSGATHSVGAMLIAAAVAGAWARTARPFVAVATAAAYGSHVLLDWLGADPSAPRGVMALWPLSGEFHLSDAHLFLRVCREYWLADCWWHNLRAVARELVILGPITVAAVVAARRALRPPRGGRTSSR